MKNCKYQKYILEYFEQQLPPQETKKVRLHLQECDHCKNYLKDLTSVTPRLNVRKRPEPDKEFLSQYHQSLASMFEPESMWTRIYEKIKDAFTPLAPHGLRWVQVMAVLVVGIIIGRMWSDYKSAPVETVSEKIINIQPICDNDIDFMTRFFSKSELFLLEIKNKPCSDETAAVDFSLKMKMANNLLVQAGYMNELAANINDESLVTYLNRLEFLLLEFTNHDKKEIQEIFSKLSKIIEETGLLNQSRTYLDHFKTEHDHI